MCHEHFQSPNTGVFAKLLMPVRLGFCHCKASVVRFPTCHIYFKASCATAFLLISIVSNLLFHQLLPLIIEVLYKQDTSAKQFLGHPLKNLAEDLQNIVILSSAIIKTLFNFRAGIQWKVKNCCFFCYVLNKTLPSDHQDKNIFLKVIVEIENNRSLLGVTVRNWAEVGLTKSILKFIIVFVYYVVSTVY